MVKILTKLTLGIKFPINDQGAHDRNFLVRFNNEFFLKGANEQNTR